MRTFRMTRQDYIDGLYRSAFNSNVEEHTPSSEGLASPIDIVYYTYTTQRIGGPVRYGALAFAGRSNRPSIHALYPTEQSRTDDINSLINARIAHRTRVQERRIARSAPHTLQVGDILDSSWGYDQTNVNFYQVTRVIGRNTVELREIRSRIVGNDAPPTQHVVAIPNDFIEPLSETDRRGRPMVRRVDGRTNGVSISSCQWATPWDGRPQYETALGWGH